MRETTLMKVLICKIHHPLMCFCKPSAAHLCTSGPLKLENTVVPCAVSAVVCNEPSSEVSVNRIGKHETSTLLKSCIRKLPCEQGEKKRVQWMDELGQQLAEIKEFESSDTEDAAGNDEESSHCLCVIL